MFRLYVDEVGTDGLTCLDKDKHRYLSLTGVAMEINHAATVLEPNMNWIKSHVFRHDPDSPLILHRSDIVGLKGPFGILASEETRDLFDRSILRLFSSTEFKIITAIIDKQAMLKKENWKNKEPYHYLMDILAEKYVQLLERHQTIGDIMPERRGKKDELLQAAFSNTREKGTYYVSSTRIKSSLRGDKLKFREKHENIAGLQLCDLLAHPSHMFARELSRHEVCIGNFANRIKPILFGDKYDRSSTGKIIGYGIKFAS
jgi:hypothetical protein